MVFFFSLFSVIGVVSSFCVFLSANPVYSVFYLILVFCSTCSLMLLLTVDFLGLIFIVVYVGAIAVLFLFVVMMFNIELVHLRLKYSGVYYFVFSLAVVFLSVFIFLFKGYEVSSSLSVDSFESSVLRSSISFFEESTVILGLGNVTYTYFWYVFVMAGLVLLLGMVGSICLTLHHSSFVRRQEVYRQVGRNTFSSIKLVK